ncbi:MAG: hypothetical protein KJP17_06625 [Gammaproteobacteria bacterium]|nr:hypothetical protein [Gammaproteobacteria bacterium]
MMKQLTRSMCTLGVVLLLAACGGPASAPEEELRAWVADGVDAASAKERRRLVGMISSAYTDARGNERSDIEKLLRVYFLRQHKIALLSNIEEITVYDDTAARVMLTVGMAGTNDGVLGFSADAYRFALELEKDGNEWLLIAARWGELGDELR